MPEQPPEDKWRTFEERLAKLEQGTKDRWDKFQIIAALLIPAAVAFAGYYFSNALARAQTDSAKALAAAQLASEERRAQASQAVSEASMHVSQAELVATFMKSLLSTNRAERDLAIRAVLLALPEAGPQLVAAVQSGALDSETREVAETALRQRRDRLVNDLYAADDSVRQKAAEDLVLGFRSDPALIDTINREAQRNRDNANGIHKSTVVLQAVPTQQLQAKQAAVQAFTDLAKQGGEQTKALAGEIQLRSHLASDGRR
jgi:hypothetical protein